MDFSRISMVIIKSNTEKRGISILNLAKYIIDTKLREKDGADCIYIRYQQLIDECKEKGVNIPGTKALRES